MAGIFMQKQLKENGAKSFQPPPLPFISFVSLRRKL